MPCRIYKNISYGAWGVTNNASAASLFEGEVAYDAALGPMLDAALARVAQDPRRQGLAPLMQRVSDHHTYLNRLAALLELAVDRAEFVGPEARGTRAKIRPDKLRRRRWARRVIGRGWS